MKKLFFLIIPILFFSCNTDKTDSSFIYIEGSIAGLNSGKIVLSRYYNNKMEPVDSTDILQSKFSFKKVKFTEPEMYYLIINNGLAVIEFFIDKDDITIEANMNDERALRIIGSDAQNEYSSFLENNSLYENKQNRLYAQRDVALQNSDTAMLLHLDSVYRIAYAEQIDFIKEYTLTNNTSEVSAFIATRSLFDVVNLDEIKKIANNFSSSIEKTIYVTELNKKIRVLENVAIGRQAPDFTVSDINGNQISLSSLQGQIVLLDFSASWSESSKARNNDMKKIYEQYKNHGFEIFTVSLEENKDKWQQYVKAENIPWIQTSELKGVDSEIIKLYGVSKLPYTILLDKKGLVVFSSSNLSEIYSALSGMFVES